MIKLRTLGPHAMHKRSCFNIHKTPVTYQLNRHSLLRRINHLLECNSYIFLKYLTLRDKIIHTVCLTLIYMIFNYYMMSKSTYLFIISAYAEECRDLELYSTNYHYLCDLPVFVKFVFLKVCSIKNSMRDLDAIFQKSRRLYTRAASNMAI